MASLSDVVLTVASTLTVQGVYFVFFSYPSEVSSKRLDLESRQEQFSAQMNDEGDWQLVVPQSLEKIGTLSNGLFQGMQPDAVVGLVSSLKVCQAELHGLEVAEQLLASHIGKMAEIVKQALDIASGWNGAAQPATAIDFSLKMKTVLYSARAVKRAHDRELTDFWLEMRREAWGLKPLVSRFVASAVSLNVIAVALLGYGFITLARHGVSHVASTAGWIVASFLVSAVIFRVMLVIGPVNGLIRSIEATCSERLKEYSALASLMKTAGQADAGERKSA